VTKKVNGKINAKDLLEILDGIEEHHNEEEILSIIQSLKAIVIRKI
jgi:Ca2+-binding EF-hand superfamily protein